MTRKWDGHEENEMERREKGWRRKRRDGEEADWELTVGTEREKSKLIRPFALPNPTF